jgi:hypothetical protein
MATDYGISSLSSTHRRFRFVVSMEKYFIIDVDEFGAGSLFDL